jgi:hypothetical protein
MFHFIHVRKFVHSLGPASQFTDGLGTSQHQDTEQRELAATEIHGVAQAVAVFLDAMPCSADD